MLKGLYISLFHLMHMYSTLLYREGDGVGRRPLSGLKPGTLRLCTPRQLCSFCSLFLGLSGIVEAPNSERQHDINALSAVEA